MFFFIFVLLAQMGRVQIPHHDPYLFPEVKLRMTLAKMTMIRI